MPDREKVINQIDVDIQRAERTGEMLVYVGRKTAKDALALLKEQEAKCLTKAELNDLNKNQFVWIEGRTSYLYCLQIIGICRDKTGVSDIQFNAPTSYLERSTKRYGISYRIWTNKPTEKQSKAVKWDEGSYGGRSSQNHAK